ncbi:MAG: hypothetical protein KDK75_10555 [Alphaproteobacteria bacterium]|nr:hypothetical protein [Alphaproteobacteria bacterium]
MTLDPIAILRHGIRSVLRNAGATLRISWPWLIIIAIAYVLFAFVMTTSGFGTTPLDSEKGAAPVLLAGLILFIVSALGFSSIAVNWHRYILLDEMPDLAQKLRVDGRVLSYFWRGLLAGLLTLLIMIVPIIILSTVAGSLLSGVVGQMEGAPGRGMGPGIWIVTIVIGAFATALFFRFALALPAIALGREEIGLFDSWGRTRGLFWPLLMVAAGTVILQVVTQVIVDVINYVAMSAVGTVALVITVPLMLVVLWFFTFLGVTLLTTLYGHIVENRRL